MSYEEIVSRIASENNLSEDFTDKVYRAFWRAVKEHIEALPLKEDLTDEQFLALKTNFNIPSIGKLNVTLDRYKRVKYVYNQSK